jgi:hypothetical protein
MSSFVSRFPLAVARLSADFVCCSQMQVMHRVLVERLDAQRATERDHPRSRFDVAHPPALIDGFSANNTKVVPILDIGIF